MAYARFIRVILFMTVVVTCVGSRGAFAGGVFGKHTSFRSRLCHAMASNDFEKVKSIINSKKESDGVNFHCAEYGIGSPMKWAVQHKEPAILELLLLHGADANEIIDVYDSKYLLHLAVENEDFETVKLLRKYGADLNSYNAYWISPLNMAESPEMIKIILKEGDDVNAADKGGRTPFHMAASTGNIEKMKMLLEFGANINQGTISGETALHLAVQGAHYKTVEFLLKNGANAELTNQFGHTPLEVARQCGGCYKVSVLLQNHFDEKH